MSEFLFTSESVSEGHPDKICDRISDAILDAYIKRDPQARVAVETMVTSNIVILAGEIRSKIDINDQDIESIVRQTIKYIGYEQKYFHWKHVEICNYIHGQSIEIAKGVDASDQHPEGAGDQGMMFGYATNETKDFMPAAIYYCNQILENIGIARHKGKIQGIKPDGKIQLTLRYKDHVPVGVDTLVISIQHEPYLKSADISTMMMNYINDILPWSLQGTQIYVNQAGSFVEGGPHVDTGLTGRKIVVDGYGGVIPSGGGCFSGKDPTKVDRSAAYAARYIAKNIVAAKLADRCTLQLSYGIGIAKNLSIFVDCHNTHKVDMKIIYQIAANIIDLTVIGIRETLQLNKPIYTKTSSYGHFGRKPTKDGHFSWEKLDLQDKIKQML